MRITLKCSGLVLDDLPIGADGAGAEMDVAEDASVGVVLADLGLSPDEGYLIMVDEQVIVPSEVATRRLKAGDRLVILPPLRGG